MKNLAVVISPSITGDIYIIGGEEAKAWMLDGFTLAGYASTEEEASALAEKHCYV